MLILTDFDGTITSEDVTNAILDRVTGTGWRGAPLTSFRAGEISHLELMQIIYEDLRLSPDEVTPYHAHITIRDGWNDFREFCRANGHFLAVVSGGLDWYLAQYISDVPVFCYKGDFDVATKRHKISLPDNLSVDYAAKEDFKVRVLEELKKEHGSDRPVVFIGDGHNDFPVSQHADRVFAIRGSRLARLRHEQNLPVTEFDTFSEIIVELEK
jgi:2-hydroxy-3-keto-5-methylthiopentenyl-1-phosphate phosphatase